MFSPEVIRDFQAEAASAAAKAHRIPLIIWPEDMGKVETLHRIPNLGDYVPEGWRMIKTYFVDSSGWGEKGEPAMTAQEFALSLKVGKGYALVQEGQFQVYVGEFVRA